MANETLTSAFSDIADAIRAKGVTGTMTPLQMPTKIADIPSGSGTRYGVSGESILGPVDVNGALQEPNTPFIFSSTEIVSIPVSGLPDKFKKNKALVSVNLPNLTTVNSYGLASAFQDCTSLSSVNLSSLSDIRDSGLSNAFKGCTSLISISIPNITSLSRGYELNATFQGCTSLQTVDLSNLSSVSGSQSSQFNNCFMGCTGLKKAYLTKFSSQLPNTYQNLFNGCTSLELVDFSQSASVPPMSYNMFANTNSTFQIVVPDALYETWIATSGWSNFSAQIVKASEYVPAP